MDSQDISNLKGLIWFDRPVEGLQPGEVVIEVQKCCHRIFRRAGPLYSQDAKEVAELILGGVYGCHPDHDPMGLFRASVELILRHGILDSSSSSPLPIYMDGSDDEIVAGLESLVKVGFQPVTLSQLIAEKTIVEIPWLVDRVLPKEGAGIISGTAGIGKSWSLLDLAIETARGGKWLQQFQTTKGKVLYFDEESTGDLLRRRLSKLLKHKGLIDEDLGIHLCVGQCLCLSNLEIIGHLDRVLEILKPSLVIIDSFIRVHRGDENSARDMAIVFKEVKTLVRKFGCFFLFADHQRKPGLNQSSLDLQLRGSTEKVAFVDSLLSLQKKNKKIIVEHSKSRCAQPIPSFYLRILDETPDSTTVRYDGEVKEEGEDQEENDKREKVRKVNVSAFLDQAIKTEEWISRQELVRQATEVGISEKALDQALTDSTGEGGIFERQDRGTQGKRGGRAAFFRRKPQPSLPISSSSPNFYREKRGDDEIGDSDPRQTPSSPPKPGDSPLTDQAMAELAKKPEEPDALPF